MLHIFGLCFLNSAEVGFFVVMLLSFSPFPAHTQNDVIMQLPHKVKSGVHMSCSSTIGIVPNHVDHTLIVTMDVDWHFCLASKVLNCLFGKWCLLHKW